MSTKNCYRYFGLNMGAQERWLNRMAEEGWRLTEVGKLRYTFESCPPGSVEYRLDFIGDKNRAHAEEYHDFLEEMGWKAFYKNANLNWSVGKVYWNPWAEKGGRIGSRAVTFDREVLIVEKARDGKPFRLYSSGEDRLRLLRRGRNGWLSLAVAALILALLLRSAVWGVLAAAAALPGVRQWREISTLAREAQIRE